MTLSAAESAQLAFLLAKQAGNAGASAVVAIPTGPVPEVTYTPPGGSKQVTQKVAKINDGKGNRRGGYQILNPQSNRYVSVGTQGSRKVVAYVMAQHPTWIPLYKQGLAIISGGAVDLDPATKSRSRSSGPSKASSGSSGLVIPGVGAFDSVKSSDLFRRFPDAFIAKVSDAGLAAALQGVAPYIDTHVAIIFTNGRGGKAARHAVPVGSKSHLAALAAGEDPEIISKEEAKVRSEERKHQKPGSRFEPAVMTPGIKAERGGLRSVRFGSDRSIEIAALDPENERKQIAVWLAVTNDQGAADEFRALVAAKKGGRGASATIRRSPVVASRAPPASVARSRSPSPVTRTTAVQPRRVTIRRE